MIVNTSLDWSSFVIFAARIRFSFVSVQPRTSMTRFSKDIGVFNHLWILCGFYNSWLPPQVLTGIVTTYDIPLNGHSQLGFNKNCAGKSPGANPLDRHTHYMFLYEKWLPEEESGLVRLDWFRFLSRRNIHYVDTVSQICI